jgi:hypothetical protein
MLVATPLANLNIFSNTPAMAQEYDNYGDSYSKFPTDDKKYECRTGPFEGFFVSSVEFCKHNKFDDRKDNRIDNKTGTQGPPGATGTTGATGAQGPQGLPGITQINGTNYYSIDGSDILPGGFLANSTAECDTGDVALSGEYALFGTPSVTVFGSTNTPPDSWQTIIGGIPGQAVVTTVNCFDNPPQHIP